MVVFPYFFYKTYIKMVVFPYFFPYFFYAYNDPKNGRTRRPGGSGGAQGYRRTGGRRSRTTPCVERTPTTWKQPGLVMGRSGKNWKNYEKWENQLNRSLKTLKTMKRCWYQGVPDGVWCCLSPIFLAFFSHIPSGPHPMAMAASHLSSGLCLHSSGNGTMEGLNKLSATRSCQKCVTNHGWGSKYAGSMAEAPSKYDDFSWNSGISHQSPWMISWENRLTEPIKPLYPNIYPQYLSPWYWWTNPINQLGTISIRCLNPECFCCIVIHLGWFSDVCKLYQQWFVTIFPTKFRQPQDFEAKSLLRAGAPMKNI